MRIDPLQTQAGGAIHCRRARTSTQERPSTSRSAFISSDQICNQKRGGDAKRQLMTATREIAMAAQVNSLGASLRDRALFAALTKPPRGVSALRVTIPHASLRDFAPSVRSKASLGRARSRRCAAPTGAPPPSSGRGASRQAKLAGASRPLWGAPCSLLLVLEVVCGWSLVAARQTKGGPHGPPWHLAPLRATDTRSLRAAGVI